MQPIRLVRTGPSLRSRGYCLVGTREHVYTLGDEIGIVVVQDGGALTRFVTHGVDIGRCAGGW